MDKNTAIGIVLIVLCFWAYLELNKPSKAELEAQQRMQDSIELVQQEENVDPPITQPQQQTIDTIAQQKLDSIQYTDQYGIFGKVMSGADQSFTLQNDLFTVTVDAKGGRISDVQLNDYYKFLDKKGKTKEMLHLMDGKNNFFGFELPVSSIGKSISTNDMFFDLQNEDSHKIILRAALGNGKYIDQVYEVFDNQYKIDYSIKFVGLDDVINIENDEIDLKWTNYQSQLEINKQFDKQYSVINYSEEDNDVRLMGRQNKTIDRTSQPLHWIAYTNQFFNSTLIPDQGFRGAVMEAENLPDGADYLKRFTSTASLGFQNNREETIDFSWFIGPNDFKRLRGYEMNMEQIIPFGQSVFGTINRWVIRPIFNFLQTFIGSKGIVILLLTFIVKAALYPLTYRMLYSQSKMGALKPEMAKLKEKFKDDPQKQQMENMKLYREYGVNPAGGCLPMILQMPIWFALYRFFPASIDFRQASFLWANDLSSYDVAFWLPTELPIIGDHISLFTMLWAVSILLYTYYNNKIMDMTSINPAMKYMQYFMPLMFIFFFNNYASGLTCYLLFANIINISQTLITKNYVINHKKIKAELEANKKKPKKKGGFQQRLEQALKEQQRIAAEKEKGKKGKR